MVRQEKQKIKNDNIYSFATTLDASVEDVNGALLKFLKNYGKPKQQDEAIVLAECIVNGKAFSKALYGNTRQAGAATYAWIGVNLNEWAADSAMVVGRLEAMVKEFGVNFYRDKIQVQIDEAQRAVDIVSRQQQRTLNEQQSIQQKIESNKKEYQQLLKAIQKNRSDSVALVLRLNKNTASTDSLRTVADKVKQAVVFQKERQGKVN
ncbi:hypothetical protein SanaruYs_10790 [Chryseotalea sanaruensis]|uniref:Uncharacterized protein n=2 Tax=Chryseotalea sanaruensis TaxID=2482724 RepID=A0A401U7J6_9BACT|nr:hypothetical protein SanaruYs_10790 [Chryseotalea sanaruensis]